jgi:hypothetical protein
MSVTFESKQVKCGKDHYCIWCGGMILKGEAAHYYKGIFQGDFQNWHMHPECFEANTQDHPEDGFTAYCQERGTLTERNENGK